MREENNGIKNVIKSGDMKGSGNFTARI